MLGVVGPTLGILEVILGIFRVILGASQLSRQIVVIEIYVKTNPCVTK